MSLNKRIIGGGPAPQCGIQGASSQDTNESLSGDNALEGLAAFNYNGSYWIAQTGGQSIYLYDGQGTSLNNANTSGINPTGMGFHNGRIYTWDTYQYNNGSGGWKSWNVTSGTMTETDHNSQYPRVPTHIHINWHITDPLNPARFYYGNYFVRDVYCCYYGDFPNNDGYDGFDTGYNIDTTISQNINNVTYDGNYFWLSEYSSSGGAFYQAYVGGSKGDPFELTGVKIDKVSGFDYYSMMVYNGQDDRLWIKRRSSTSIRREIPDYGSNCPTPSYMDFLCVAGGGGAGGSDGGGGGAGGLRTSYGSTTGGANTISEGGLELTGGTYTITVGAGGTGSVGYSTTTPTSGAVSSIAHSSLQTIDCLGGGRGGMYNHVNGYPEAGGSGGGGGGETNMAGFKGRTGQGRNGESEDGSAGTYHGGGGGGALEEGGTDGAGQGGDGLSVSITGSAVTYAGGGAGGGLSGTNQGGAGGGGNSGIGSGSVNGSAGTTNTGSGGGGGADGSSSQGGAGGSGVVILRLPTASYSGTTTGSPTVTTSGSDTIIKFTGSGTYVHS